MKTRLALLLLLLAVLLAACGTGPGHYAVTKAEVTDFITNTEERNNGTFMVWAQTDITSAYCTKDLEVYELARSLRESHTRVTIEYATINVGDTDYGYTDLQGKNNGGCDHESKTIGVRTYRLVELRAADSGVKSDE